MGYSKKPKHLIVLSLLFLISSLTFSQSSKKSINYSKSPYWIEMMNNPNANYFETIKAYQEFWANRKQPKEEDDIIGQSKTAEGKKSFLSRWFKSKEEREEEEIRKYALDVKKFNHWKLKVQPYVQEDGTILDANARLKLWEEQHRKN